jgi:hypothetical protein
MAKEEDFKGLIPSKEMLERNKRDLENLQGPPLPPQSPPREPISENLDEDDANDMTDFYRAHPISNWQRYVA